MKIVNELSSLAPHTEETNILTFDDPELFKYPVAYLCGRAVGLCRTREAAGFALRTSRRAGSSSSTTSTSRTGAIRGQKLRVMPEARSSTSISRTDLPPPSSNQTLDIPQYYGPAPAILWAVYEDNDPTRRIMMMINYNTDISEFWNGRIRLRPIDESNEAYKLGVNYIIYGMTH